MRITHTCDGMPRHGLVSRAIYAAYRQAQPDEHRAHLDASLIGHECPRAIWYAFRWAVRPMHAGQMLLLFKTGHLAEPRFVDDLRRIGATVLDRDEGGQPFGFKAFGGHYGGSLDGVATGLPYAPAESPRTWAALEFKTHSHRSFTTLKARGVRLSKPRHYAQMQAYMLDMQLSHALYLAKDKDTDELHDEWIALDRAYAITLKTKALGIIKAPEPPVGVGTGPGHPTCQRCSYQALCFGTDVPEPTCRSCAHATPVTDRAAPDGEGGGWHCAKWSADLPTLQAQREGCTGHRYIPILLARFADATGYHNADVSYRALKTGATFTNGEGPGALSSHDIHLCPDKPALPILPVLPLAAGPEAQRPTEQVPG